MKPTFISAPASCNPAGEWRKALLPGEKLALVIPTLHEAANLDQLLTRVHSVLARACVSWEAIVVDDDSGDGVERIVEAFSRRDRRIRLLVRRGERGLSGAILHGWQNTDATILGVMDADGQHPPESLPALIAAISRGTDVAIASRFVEGSCGGENPVRRLISWTANTAARPLPQPHLQARDLLSGFFLVRRRCVEHSPFQAAGFKLLLEILVRGRVRSIEEVPYRFGKRRGGRSKANARVAWDYISLLARLYRARYAGAGIPEAAAGD